MAELFFRENMQRIAKGSDIIRLNFVLVILLMAAVIFSSGCDERQGVQVGGTPPGISGNDIRGEYVTLSQFKGNVVVLYFWTNSCCADGLKELEPFFSQNKQKGLTVLAVNEGDTKETVLSCVKKNGLTFSTQTDEHAMTAYQYGIIGFPTIFILDRNGITREKILGHIPIAKLKKLVSRYL
jgi:peroxiredoxin